MYIGLNHSLKDDIIEYSVFDGLSKEVHTIADIMTEFKRKK